MVNLAACVLPLLLTCLAAYSASETEQGGTMVDTSNGPSAVEISGVRIVTVGIPYVFQCTANCHPGCKFTWTRGNVTTQGPDLSLRILHIVPNQTLTCTVVNPTTGKSASVKETLQVIAGPSNIQISGPPMLTFGFKSNFTCSAHCYPSCSYSWRIILDGLKYKTAQGNTISVTPPNNVVSSETLICEAEDTVSHLFISTVLKVWVATLSDISIAGDGTVTMGKQYKFICLATCIPSCIFKWKYMGKTYLGDQAQISILHQGAVQKSSSQLEITVSDDSKIEPLTCEATNSVSRATITSTKNLTVIDPISVRPSSKAQPVAGEPFSLQCVGSQNPSSITWLKNEQRIVASERVWFSPDYTTMSFSPLLQADDGLYKCVVAEGELPIQSVGYKMQVNYGPSSVVISGVETVAVEKLYVFHCSASCYPTCQFTWTCGDVTTGGPELRLELGEFHSTQNLTCTAVNPATGRSASAGKTLEVTAEPSNIRISGPAFLTAGVASKFTCSADCYPSCSYTWSVKMEDVLLRTTQGDTISVTPPSSTVTSETLICKAENTVSHVSSSSALHLWVAGLSDITITGDSTVSIGKQYKFICSATCIPSCTFTWTYKGKTFQGNQVQLPFRPGGDEPNYTCLLEILASDISGAEPLTCEATNTISNATITTTKNLTVTDPFLVHPASQAPPVAGEPFSLQCAGSQSSASITWLKNKQPVVASERVRFSPDNNTMSFSPVLQADDGLYQCLVLEAGQVTHNKSAVESGNPVMSVGYLMQVNYGPGEVWIVKPNKGPVGEEMVVSSGSTTELQCLSDCFPACSFSWFDQDTLLSTNSSILFTPVTPPYRAALTCVAFNSVTEGNRTARTVVVVPDGPKDVVISGPGSLEVGVVARFTCSAECSPSCSFTWTVYGKNVTGSVMDIYVSRHVSEEPISCWAENTYTGRTAAARETLAVSDSHWCGC